MSRLNILDNVSQIKKLDSQNMLGSLESIDKQVEHIVEESKNLQIPADYKNIKNIVVLGMGGSTLGAHVIALIPKVPLTIVNGYHVPKFVTKESLVIVSSYSGTTEEPLFALKEALKLKAKILVITSGGELAKLSKKYTIPGLIFSTEFNPCKSPRMGLGYSILGLIMMLNKVGLIDISKENIKNIIRVLKKYQIKWGVSTKTKQNFAKKLAEKTNERSVWYFGSEHLSGNVHIAANQMNENAKRFAGFFIIPELNHHLLEGMMFPKNNNKNILIILIESELYDKRVQKRYEITKKILEKNKIVYQSYKCTEKNKFEQVFEVLMLGSFVSFYSALLEGIDPTAIPFVDYFKEALAKK